MLYTPTVLVEYNYLLVLHFQLIIGIYWVCDLRQIRLDMIIYFYEAESARLHAFCIWLTRSFLLIKKYWLSNVMRVSLKKTFHFDHHNFHRYWNDYLINLGSTLRFFLTDTIRLARYPTFHTGRCAQVILSLLSQKNLQTRQCISQE